ncbi:hypothetical protein SLE2022_040580 [Rubroshorea leprosula]
MKVTDKAPSPSPSSTSTTSSETSTSSPPPPPSRIPVDFSPTLIAMVVVVAAAILVITYSRLISRRLLPSLLRLLRFFRRRRPRRRYLPSTTTDLESLPPSDSFELPLSPYGLDDSAIKRLPLSLYNSKSKIKSPKDCAVCLLEFEDDEYVRTLPVCSHAFHVDCIDVWLKSHANCPLCRAVIFAAESPFIPLMAARIRPSLDDPVLPNTNLDSLTETPLQSHATTITEITEEPSPRGGNVNLSTDCEENRFNFVLKRSYSFGFERNLAAERMLTEPNTASPWRYRRGTNGFWSKRPSPFGSLMSKPRVFSFRGIKVSPFFRRRGFFPLSESSVRFSGSGSSRRNRSMTSPMFPRSEASSVAAFSSSRLRCGDPEALLSPERFNRR